MVFLTVETLVTVLLVNSKLERKLYRGSNPCDVRNARLSSCLVEKTTLCQTHCDNSQFETLTKRIRLLKTC